MQNAPFPSQEILILVRCCEPDQKAAGSEDCYLAILSNGQSIEWLCVYTVKRYADIDPIVSHCRNEVMPLFWDPKIGWENSDPKVQGFMKDVVKHGFGSGLALPLKQEGVPNGLFSITSDQSLEIERSHYEEVLPLYKKSQ